MILTGEQVSSGFKAGDKVNVDVLRGVHGRGEILDSLANGTHVVRMERSHFNFE